MTDNDKQTEEKIFEAATEVFLEKGMDGARMQDIADRAGINKALLHYYFRTKDHLFDAVFEKKAGEMFKKFAPVFDEGLSLEEKIRLFLREHMTFLQKNPRLPAFILTEINHHPEKFRKFIKNVDFTSFWSMLSEKNKDDIKKYNLSFENMPQIMASMVAMSVFPFAARGILEGILGKLNIDFDNFIEERKDFAADFVIKAISK